MRWNTLMSIFFSPSHCCMFWFFLNFVHNVVRSYCIIITVWSRVSL
jgi:hypothetical protein